MTDGKEKKREKQQQRRAYSTMLIVLALLLLGGTGIYQYKRAEALEQMVTNQYTRAFEELVDSVNDLDVTLSKSAVSSSAGMMTDIAENINRQAAFAQSNLGQLPISHVELDNAAKFLSQVGDFTYMLTKKLMSGGRVSADEQAQLAALTEYSGTLTKSLDELQAEFFNGNLDFHRLESEGNIHLAAQRENTIGAGMETLEKNFSEYPSLIYDGPFSDHVNKMEAKRLRNEREITREEAQQKAARFLGDDVSGELSFLGETDGTIAAYSFGGTGAQGQQLALEITKQGGYVVYMLENRTVEERNMDAERATQIGAEFLKQNGIWGMKESYWELVDNIATINYAFMQDGIMMYPDLIKLKIALDDGEILGYESRGFLMAHEDRRSLPEVLISPEQARAMVNPNLTVEAQSMAVIPLDGGREVLCYEFKGNFGEKKFIVYINAATGAEEEILILVQGEEGTLTM